MMSVTFADPWLEGPMEKEAVTQMEELNRSLSGQSSSSSSSWSSDNLDDSLTSLHWLQEFSISSASRGPHTSSHQHMEAPTSPLAGDLASIGLSQTPSKPTAASYSRVQTQRVSHGQCLEEMDFSTNNVKPPYSYANMIYMAMQASNKPKITLSCIYKWITDNFCYYRHADPTWQNSIRHNLSLNKCFVKVPRQKNEPGKGGFWAIDPQHAERLLSGAYKNRNLPPVRINPAFQNNKQVEVKSEPTLAATAVEHQESCQMLRTYEESVETVPTRDTCLGEAAIQSCWLSEEKRSPFASRKVSTSCSPLFAMDVKENLSALNGNFDWDALVDSAMNGDLSMNEGSPLSPDKFLDYGNYFSQEAQEMLDSQMSSDSDLENLFPERELNQESCWNMFEGTGLNILGHTENIEPLFDLEIKIESLP